MLVVITRPKEEAALTAKKVQMAGFVPLCCPVMEMKSFSLDAGIGDVSALIATSPQAIKWAQARTQFHHLPIYVVGMASADLARKVGFKNVRQGPGTAQELCEMIIQDRGTDVKDAESVCLYLRGKKVRFDVVDALREKNILAREAVVYEATPILKLAPDILKEICADVMRVFLFYSVEAVKIFLSLFPRAKKDILKNSIALCLSDQVAENIPSDTFKEVLWAKQPNEEALLDLLKYGTKGKIT